MTPPAIKEISQASLNNKTKLKRNSVALTPWPNGYFILCFNYHSEKAK
jgi:hypothetical protein